MRFIMSLIVAGGLIFTQSYAAKPPSDPLKPIVTNHVQTYMNNNQIPGVAVGIFYQGQSYFYNFGLKNKATGKKVTTDTIFGIGSVTKVFITSLLGLCVLDGSCHLDDPIISYLPDLAGASNLPIGQVTLQHIATHTSSLPRDPQDLGVNPDSPTARDNLWSALQAWTPDYPIGTQYLYSNLAYGLLREGMGNAFGSGFGNAVAGNITVPMGMIDTVINLSGSQSLRFAQGYNSNGQPVTYANPENYLDGGPLLSTTSDMLIFLRANLGETNTGASSNLLAAMQFAQQGYFPVNANFTQGLGWEVRSLNSFPMINKNGSVDGFVSYVAMLPQQKIAIVILANQTGAYPNATGNAILSDILGL